MNQVDRPRQETKRRADGVAFSVVDTKERILEGEICTEDPKEALAYFEAAPPGSLSAVAWRFGPLHGWRWQEGPRVPAPLHEPEFRRVQSCAYRCLAGYLVRCELPHLAIEASLRRYGGYYPDLYSGTLSIVEHELAWSLAFLVRWLDVEVLAESLVEARGLEPFTLPRYPGDEADALPPGIFLLRTM